MKHIEKEKVAHWVDVSQLTIQDSSIYLVLRIALNLMSYIYCFTCFSHNDTITITVCNNTVLSHNHTSLSSVIIICNSMYLMTSHYYM